MVLFWCGLITPKRIGGPSDLGPLSVFLYPTNLKSTVRHYRGERTRAGAQQEGGIDKGGAVIFKEAQGGSSFVLSHC